MAHRSPTRYRLRKAQWNALGDMVLRSFDQRRLGDLSTIDLRQAIVDAANSQGIPPGIALAVAMQESGIQQWDRNGNLVVSSAGAIGIFQLMPATAAQLGVDPTDPGQNIQGGISYLAQMYQEFGSWPLALAAYNWGPAKVQRGLNAGTQIPGSVQEYVTSVLAGAGVGNSIIASSSVDQGNSSGNGSAVPSSPNLGLTILAVGGAMLGVSWLLNQLD